MRRTKYLILAALGAVSCFAQRYTFKVYGDEQGLTNAGVQCFVQDRIGFIWVGTQNGLFRYDGESFKQYGRSDGLPSNRIESLGELKKTLTENSVCEFALLVRGERKVEMELDAKVIAELQKWLQKAAGNRGDDD